ncbi:MAG: 16S rRNA (guanine(966)-N(2))-methyltransferase RsmD [Calditrichota bacterium]
MPQIVGGMARGRHFKLPPGEVRPATARIKQALFDYLNPIISNSTALDLYCGSGGLGLEALSRGAGHAVFVDNSEKILLSARENTISLGFFDRSHFVQQDVFRFLAQYKVESGPTFDLIFAAPPYRIAEPGRLLRALHESHALEPGGVVCLEYAKHNEPPDPTIEHFFLDRRRVYGETVVDVWDYKVG